MEEENDTQGVDEGAAGKDEDQKPQPQRGGRKGKKKQKFKPLDLSAFPDPTPTAPTQTSQQESRSSWSGNSGSGSSWGQRDQQGGATAWSGNRGGGQNWGQRNQGYNSGQQYNRSQDYYQDRGSNVALSKALVTLLRHGKPRDIPLDSGGYAYLNEIVKHPQFQRFNTSEKGILDVVGQDNKKRFEFEKVGETYKIRATQGHSVKLGAESSGLIPLTDPKKHSVIVHGTYQKNWRTIKKQGLNRMSRTHVHFAIGYIGETQVTSGMRYSCDVVIELDLTKALQAGLKFFESKNGVVLCEGDQNGSVSPKFFKKVKKWNEREQAFKDIDFHFEEP